MTNYNEDYYFLRYDEENKRAPFLTPDTNTVERRYQYIRPLMGSAPLVFTNGFSNDFKAARIVDEIADVMFDGATFIASNRIRQRLLELDLPNVWMHPSIYIDDKGCWHEDYWYVGFDGFIDCWDRTTSKYNPTPRGSGPEPRFSVRRYSLDPNILEKIPLRERLLFRMGGDTNGFVVCHVDLLKLFRNGPMVRPITG
ncbi:hypothetical protein [Pseudoduganella lutea]|uniref:Uncharacterized protein n=1 Tax=Pseudoduganella lutea TaxID=321985 RepID=A0A4P6L3D9_9BURK|nr:hypothetical protein [Pseudoduganella lutea]QBE65957.1 hypothetical protein EWM63_25675 [Pseudoduganella lutea]